MDFFSDWFEFILTELSGIIPLIIGIILIATVAAWNLDVKKQINDIEKAKKRTKIYEAFFICGLVFFIIMVAYSLMVYIGFSSPGSCHTGTQFNENEIEAFNNSFTSFEGAVTGSQIKALLTRLIANQKTYDDELEKIPYVYINEVSKDKEPLSIEDGSEETIVNEEVVETKTYRYIDSSNIVVIPEKGKDIEYIRTISAIKNGIENKHSYYVSFTYQDNGMVDFVIISYDAEQKGKDIDMNHLHRDEVVSVNN